MPSGLDSALDWRTRREFCKIVTQKLIRPLRSPGSAPHPERCRRDVPLLHSLPLSDPLIGGLQVEVNEVLVLVVGPERIGLARGGWSAGTGPNRMMLIGEGIPNVFAAWGSRATGRGKGKLTAGRRGEATHSDHLHPNEMSARNVGDLRDFVGARHRSAARRDSHRTGILHSWGVRTWRLKIAHWHLICTTRVCGGGGRFFAGGTGIPVADHPFRGLGLPRKKPGEALRPSYPVETRSPQPWWS